MGHLLRAYKLSIRPEILGVVSGMLKHKTKWIFDFFWSYLLGLAILPHFSQP